MREVTDEALQRLYRACRSKSGFPGDIPAESQGPPSTTEIFDAVGLMRPLLADMGSIEDFQKSVSTSPPNSTTYSDSTQNSTSGNDPSDEGAFCSRRTLAIAYSFLP
ncbi:hypothetical protein LTR84_011305 [Exophiala bonariae]|uniref:Uncharacterized protein n=1 Tax=Exophiala bonariae TaxID=1690606 RepID=A0AAV9MS23_9EURO|nr:hypothetical protein LTR84_011305 [Exophiala bonariae]